MLEKLRNLKNQMTRASNAVVFDPSRFNDPLAEQIRWTPLKGGGTNFRTHKLFEDGTNRVGFKPTLGATLFGLIFALVGIAIPAGVAYGNIQDGTDLRQSEMLFMALFGLAFFGVGSYIYYSYSKPIVFDKLTGLYWKGWKKPDRSAAPNSMENAVRLNHIYALQILEEYIQGDKNSYYSYELNLVLGNGDRLNVIDHGNRTKLRNDAEVLSKFLGKPIWDATEIV